MCVKNCGCNSPCLLQCMMLHQILCCNFYTSCTSAAVFNLITYLELASLFIIRDVILYTSVCIRDRSLVKFIV